MVKSTGLGLGASTLLSVLIVAPLIAPMGGIGRTMSDGFYLCLFTLLLVFCLHRLFRTNNLGAIPTHLALTAVLLICIYAVSFLWSPYRLVALRNIIAASSILFVFFVLTNLRWSRIVLLKILFASSLFILANFVYWVLGGMEFRSSGLYSHRNSLAAIAYYFLFFPLAVSFGYRSSLPIRAYSFLVALMASTLVMAAASRAVFGAVLVTMATLVFWRFITMNRFSYLAYFALLLTSVIVVTIVYAYLQTLLFNPDPLNVLAREATGGNLFSGRQQFWGDILALIAERPLMGWGGGALPQNLLGQELSSHSLFLQVTLQVGLVGLAALSLFFASLWSTLYRGRDNWIVRLAASFLAGSMVRETFTVTLLQNQLVGIGSFAWVIFAVGAYYAVAGDRPNNAEGSILKPDPGVTHEQG